MGGTEKLGIQNSELGIGAAERRKSPAGSVAGGWRRGAAFQSAECKVQSANWRMMPGSGGFRLSEVKNEGAKWNASHSSELAVRSWKMNKEGAKRHSIK